MASFLNLLPLTGGDEREGAGPRLKLVSAENDVSWLPSFVTRMDRGYDRFSAPPHFTLSKPPREYLRDNLVATFQFEGLGVDSRVACSARNA